MANYNRAQRGSRTYWPSKESSSRGSNYGDRYHTDRHSENSDWNERRSGNEYYHPENSRYERMNEHYDSNQNDSSRYDREDDYRNQGNSRNKNSRIPYDRDFNSNYYGSRNTYRGGSYEGGYGNSGYDTDRSSEYRGSRSEDLGYYNNTDRSRRNREDGGYGGMGYGSGNYGAYSTNYNRYRSENDNDEDRTWWDKSRDEVSSWFGDEDAERRRDQDKLRSGQHRGKGPKGYKRSDERIKEDISDRLGDDPYIDATEIEIVVANGEVSLIGSVNDRADKRRAEDIAERVSGVQNVENRIRVKSSEGIYGKDTSRGNSSLSTSGGSAAPTNTSRKASTTEI